MNQLYANSAMYARSLAFLIILFSSSLLAAESNRDTEPFVKLSDTYLIESGSKYFSRTVVVEIGSRQFIIYHEIQDYNASGSILKIREISPASKTVGAKSELKEARVLIQDKPFTVLVGVDASVIKAPVIYFLTSTSARATGKLKRGTLDDMGNITKIVEVNTKFPLIGRSFPFLHTSELGTFLAFRSAKCCKLEIAKLVKENTFETFINIETSGSMAALASIKDINQLIYTYQRSFPTSALTKKGKPVFVRKSRFKVLELDRSNWSNEIFISESVDEVHDAFPHIRLDGGIDFYYTHGLNREKEKWSLWRRCLSKNGQLGNEELVAGHEFVHITKPNLSRGRSGRNILTFSQYLGEIRSGSQLVYTELNSDARCKATPE